MRTPPRYFALGNPQNRFGHDARPRATRAVLNGLQGQPKEYYDPTNPCDAFRSVHAGRDVASAVPVSGLPDLYRRPGFADGAGCRWPLIDEPVRSVVDADGDGVTDLFTGRPAAGRGHSAVELSRVRREGLGRRRRGVRRHRPWACLEADGDWETFMRGRLVDTTRCLESHAGDRYSRSLSGGSASGWHVRRFERSRTIASSTPGILRLTSTRIAKGVPARRTGPARPTTCRRFVRCGRSGTTSRRSTGGTDGPRISTGSNRRFTTHRVQSEGTYAQR